MDTKYKYKQTLTISTQSLWGGIEVQYFSMGLKLNYYQLKIEVTTIKINMQALC